MRRIRHSSHFYILQNLPDITDSYSEILLIKHKGKILLQLEGKDYEKQNEVYQLFLDELLTIEDEKLKLLEKEFEEL